MQRYKILRVITWLPVGGIERRLVALLPRLDRERFDVSVVCIRQRGPLADELEAAGIPVSVIPFRSRWDPRGLWELMRLMRDRKIDLVHAHMYRSNVPATVAGKFAGVRAIWGQIHNVDTWDSSRQLFTDRFLAKFRTGMIGVSERVRRDVVQHLQLPPERVRVIYNGIELERYAAARARRKALRLRERIAPENIVFLFAARLVEQKRCADFIEAFTNLQNREGGENLRAWIMGAGPLNEALRRQACLSPHPGSIHFLGERNNVEDFMAAADIFVLPSTREGFSNALVEALASGLPCVATDVGGNAEAVRDGIEGRIVPPRSVPQLQAAMESLWRDEPQRAAMSQAAIARADEFSIARMIRNTEQLYLESLEARPR